MKDRILKILEAEKMTAAEFADKLNVQRSSVSHILNGRNNPGYSFIQKILEAFPSLNTRWLLTGDGLMYEGSSKLSENKEMSLDLFKIPKTENTKSEVKNFELNNSSSTKENQLVNSIIESKNQPTKDKEITRIVFFYTDRTFDTFYPANIL